MVNRNRKGKAGKRNKKSRVSIHEKVFFVLLVLVICLVSINVAKASGFLIPDQAQGVVINDGVVDFSSLSLETKIAQMVVVHGGIHNLDEWKKMQIGGIHLFAMDEADDFKKVIGSFQDGMKVPFFVTVDLEGCLNPFSAFRDSVTFSDIKNVGEAFEKGSDDGKFLRDLGFSLNYAPVVDLDDQIWGCRAFEDVEMISELSQAYVLGLQDQGIIATAKHYPGKTLVNRDPHKFLVSASIEPQDVEPYEFLKKKGDIKAMMVSHIITQGAVDSAAVPSVVSEIVVKDLKQGYGGLIISDEINMLGLKNFYESLDEMYVAVFKAGNDIVLNFDEDPNEVYRMIKVVAGAVSRGEIELSEIDNSVKKILRMKGFEIRE
jgi:beta-N-acetylhexosaminidase